MKRTYKNILIDVVTQLYILLFVYAAISKLLDYENFGVQIGQSPLLSSFAGSIAIIVPSAELVIAILLIYRKTRVAGLFSAYTLMAMFTAYIYIILNYSSFIPCSCGGVLEKMNWNQHLAFNVAFMLMAVLAIILLPYKITKTIST